jgi:hypothetical protein
MLPPRLLAEYERALDALTLSANSALIALLATLDLSNAKASTSAIVEAFPEIAWSRGEVAAVVAADFYDEARSLANPTSTYTATLADLPPLEQLEASVRWGVKPLWTVEDSGDIATRLGGSLARFTQQPARDTIINNAAKDSHRTGFARKPLGASPCSFCLMLASRGAVYHSEALAGQGNHWHDDCHCKVIPVADPEFVPEEAHALSLEFDEATRGIHGEKAKQTAWRAHVAATRST